MSEHSPEKPVLEVTPIFEDEEQTVVRVALNGVNRRIINWGSTTVYRVLYGSIVMDLDGEIHHLADNDEIEVLHGTPYKDAGTAVMEATSRPPFDPAKIEYLE